MSLRDSATVFGAVTEAVGWLGRLTRRALFAPATAAELGWLRFLFLTMLFTLSWSFQNDFEGWALVADAFRQPMPFARLFHISAAPETVLRGVLWLWRAALLLGAVGLLTRWSTVASAVLGAYVLALPHTFGKVNHNDATVVIGLLIFALAPSGAGWSIDALVRRARSAPGRDDTFAQSVAVADERFGWAIRLLGVMSTLVLFSAGLAKIQNSGFAEWALSGNMTRLALSQHYTHNPPTNIALLLSRYEWLGPLLASGTIVLELLAPFLLLLRGRARVIGLGLLVSTMLGFWLTLGVLFLHFILLLLICFLPWSAIGPAVAQRWRGSGTAVLYDGSCGLCRRTMAVVRSLDVLRHIEILDAVRDWPQLRRRFPSLAQHHCLESMHVVSTSTGRVFSGFAAYRRVAHAAPLGWLLLPFAYLPPLAQIGAYLYRRVALGRHGHGCLMPEADK